MIDIIDEYISQHGAEAHKRRRNSTSYSNGVSMAQIAAEVVRRIPALKSISTTTIARTLLAPNKNHRNSTRYKGLVEARVPPKRNNANPNEHIDTHYCRAQVKYALEFANMFPDEVVAASFDNKDKFNVGTLAITRHQKLRRFFKTDDAPNYPDHDFPFRKSKLTPAGYELLLNKPRRSRSVSPKNTKHVTRTRSPSPRRKQLNTYQDKLGRKRIICSRSGKLDLFIAANRHYNSTSSTHSRHLIHDLLPKWLSDYGILPLSISRSVLIAITDNGPDWLTEYIINVIKAGRVWKESNLDCLIFASHAPGDSRFNMIERIWSIINTHFAGVTLPITLPGETKAPWLQDIPEEEKERKTDQVFWNANTLACKYLTNKKQNGFSITPHAENALGYEENKQHDALKNLLNNITKSKLTDPKYVPLIKEYQFYMKHCIKRHYYLQFSKCQECNYCKENPVRATNFFATLKSLGGSIPGPVVSEVYKGHYKTFLQVVKESTINGNKEVPSLDHSLPSKGDKVFKQCEFGCNYVMTSHADAVRHYLFMGHPRPPNMAKRKRASKKLKLTEV